MFRSGYITVIGRPNVGKSTLTNKIMGQKLSIVSSKPQTTRNNIKTILTGEDYQLIFVDTPGIHKPRHKLGEIMVKAAEDAFRDVDLILFLVTPDVNIGRGDQYILDQLKEVKVPVFLILNKIDENTQDKVAETLQNFSKGMDFAEIIPVSALRGKNVDVLIENMVKYMPEGPKYFPDDMITDQQERFIITETIREKALRYLSEEIPHGIAVEIVSMKKDEKGIYDIEANLLCEKETHKAIIIGKNGEMLKRISQNARLDIENLLDCKVYLRIWIKVKKDWRDNSNLLKELGYK